ncbi:hydrogenase nickel incorporation protein HypB [Acidocella sp.]|uniref:hydrogenase nickel incorporation protein HypB n=1 Tax=Acidocella sp. TaxID=50710 RepID=UPI0026359D4E|nr:hydrogenase nickel incorporation protein HypB [Acidocella sp.]
MCAICGCGGPDHKHDHDQGHDHHHDHDHDHDHDHHHAHAPGLSATRMVQVERDIFAENQRHADANRRYFAAQGLFVVNLVSSPGSGKTTLLVKTVEALKAEMPVAVIEGDQQTGLDAERIKATGVPAYQINTGKGCHLDAHGVGHALEHLTPIEDGVLFIENVGNLVCPAGFDLGEAHKVVVLSTTEGEDKPLKYPDMFFAADLMLLNKSDLLPYVDFSVEKAADYAGRVHPGMEMLTLSARSGEGMAAWLAWLRAGVAAARAGKAEARPKPRVALSAGT